MVFINIDIFSHNLYKSREISISAFDSYKDLKENENALFSSREITNKNINNLHQNFIESLLVHIENFQQQGKKIQIHSTPKNLPFISSLNSHLKEKGLEPVSFKTKKNNYQIKKQSENRISEEMNSKYNELLDVTDKYLVCSDGGILSQGQSNEVVSGAFIVVSQDGEEERQIQLSEKDKNSDYSELFALREALVHMVNTKKTDKPINFVFDSNYASQELQAIIKKDPSLSRYSEKNSDILLDIKNIIEKNDLKLDSFVLKSHQNIFLKHKMVELNDRADELVKINHNKRRFKNTI